MRTLVFALVIAGAACRKPTVTADSGATIEVTSAQAMPRLFSTGPSLPMPRDWPAEVPIYPDAHVSKASTHARVNEAGVGERTLDFETPDAIDKVIEFYHTTFARATKVIEMNVSMAHTMQYEQADETVNITIMSAMGVTQVNVSVTYR